MLMLAHAVDVGQVVTTTGAQSAGRGPPLKLLAAGLSGGLPGGTQGKDGNEREAATGAATGRGAATNTVTVGTKTEAGEAAVFAAILKAYMRP